MEECLQMKKKWKSNFIMTEDFFNNNSGQSKHLFGDLVNVRFLFFARRGTIHEHLQRQAKHRSVMWFRTRGHNLPQQADNAYSSSLSVSCSPSASLRQSLSVWLKQLSFGPGPVDKVSVYVYLRAPSSAHYHENGLSPPLILRVSVVINVFIQILRKHGGEDGKHGAPSRRGCGWACHLALTGVWPQVSPEKPPEPCTCVRRFVIARVWGKSNDQARSNTGHPFGLRNRREHARRI